MLEDKIFKAYKETDLKKRSKVLREHKAMKKEEKIRQLEKDEYVESQRTKDKKEEQLTKAINEYL